jgi:hypothetical protein
MIIKSKSNSCCNQNEPNADDAEKLESGDAARSNRDDEIEPDFLECACFQKHRLNQNPTTSETRQISHMSQVDHVSIGISSFGDGGG